MAKTVKAKSAEQAPVVESAPAQTAAPKVKKVKAPKEASAPVVEAPKVEQQVSSESAPVDAVLSEKSTEFFAKLQQVGALISALKTEYRLIEKQWSKEKKAVEKLNSKNRKYGIKNSGKCVLPRNNILIKSTLRPRSLKTLPTIPLNIKIWFRKLLL